MPTKKKRQSAHKPGARKPRGSINDPLQVFVKKDFLTKKELRELTRFVLSHEAEFIESTVVPDGVPEGANDPSYRKSRVLYELGDYGTLIHNRLLAVLPEVLGALKREAFPLSHIDIQLTASNDGDFFKVHQDNSLTEPLDVTLRELSFVYYFNTEPKAFSGGQLRFYDGHDGEVEDAEKRRTRTITPNQNTLVFFPSSYDHEVLPVRCPTQKFAHSRFTVNGWLIKEATASNEEPGDEEETADQDESNDMGWLVDAARALTVQGPRPFPKVYLTLEEASEFSGLSTDYLERLVHEQKVAAIDDGGWKIRRTDLESL
jgi:Rps23 Pro-64 3,4-dihydroxylase Tpa1-like proline 4-hydroxylase